MKNGSKEYVLSVLETFHLSIKFTYVKDVDNTPPFSDVLFIRISDHIRAIFIEKKPTVIYTYIGMHLRLYLGNVEHSECWFYTE